MAHPDRVKRNYADCDSSTLQPVTKFTEILTTSIKDYCNDLDLSRYGPHDKVPRGV